MHSTLVFWIASFISPKIFLSFTYFSACPPLQFCHFLLQTSQCLKSVIRYIFLRVPESSGSRHLDVLPLTDRVYGLTLGSSCTKPEQILKHQQGSQRFFFGVAASLSNWAFAAWQLHHRVGSTAPHSWLTILLHHL